MWPDNGFAMSYYIERENQAGEVRQTPRSSDARGKRELLLSPFVYLCHTTRKPATTASASASRRNRTHRVLSAVEREKHARTATSSVCVCVKRESAIIDRADGRSITQERERERARNKAGERRHDMNSVEWRQDVKA